MFIGEYKHTIDTKKRLALPSKFRSSFKNKAVITRGLDNCLFVYSMQEWKKIAEKLGNMPVGESSTRSFVRLMLAGAVDVELDSQGRILVPDYLKDYAGLGKEVIVAGLFNRLEIWDKTAWEKYKENAEKNQDKIAEELGKLGIY
ncbi:MAG: division/cell wall cluster transcriptional repressor MraZ [Patescibacteria group bacterium]